MRPWTYLENAIVVSEISICRHENGDLCSILKGQAFKDCIRLFFRAELLIVRYNMERSTSECAVIRGTAIVSTLVRRVPARPQRRMSVDTADI
jgi:hypothetical protein